MRVNARPAALEIDPRTTAIVVVDMQNDFGSRGGMFDRAGIPIDDIEAIVGPIGRVLEAGRAAGMRVAFLKMQFAEDLSDAGAPDAPNRVKHRRLGLGESSTAPDGRRGRILVEDTWNTDIVAPLRPVAGDIVVPKHRYSGFYETSLDDRLRESGVQTLIFTGATTSVCVESTLRDAFYRDYRCLLLEDCTAEPIGGQHDRTNHDATLLVVETLFGWVSTSNDVLAALGAAAAIR